MESIKGNSDLPRFASYDTVQEDGRRITIIKKLPWVKWYITDDVEEADGELVKVVEDGIIKIIEAR